MTKVLFICLGNICRSPLAEGHFKSLLTDKGIDDQFFVDSAAISSYNIGQQPDSRTIKNALSHNLILNHSAREITTNDLSEFDYLIVMDSEINQYVQRMLTNAGLGGAKLFMMRQFDNEPGNGEVPDPYYYSEKKFEEVYQIINRSNPVLLDFILNRLNKSKQA